MSENSQETNMPEQPNFSFVETSVVPFKSYKDYQFDKFIIRDMIKNEIVPRLRLGYYFSDNGKTYFTFIELQEIENILASLDFLLERSKEKQNNFVEYNAQTQYGFIFGSYWVKKEGWSYFIQINSESPRIYPKEKEIKEFLKIFEDFKTKIIEEYTDKEE